MDIKQVDEDQTKILHVFMFHSFWFVTILKILEGSGYWKWKTAGRALGQKFHSNGVANQKAKELLSETWRHKPNDYQKWLP